MNLNKDPESWARARPDLVVAGSTAQARNVLEMALQDIARLAAENERLRAAVTADTPPCERPMSPGQVHPRFPSGWCVACGAAPEEDCGDKDRNERQRDFGLSREEQAHDAR